MHASSGYPSYGMEMLRMYGEPPGLSEREEDICDDREPEDGDDEDDTIVLTLVVIAIVALTFYLGWQFAGGF